MGNNAEEPGGLWADPHRKDGGCSLVLTSRGTQPLQEALGPTCHPHREGQECDVAQGPALRLLLFIMKEKESRGVKLPGFRCLPGIVVSR